MTYSKVETFNIDGCKVRVHFPDLPEEERAKRKNALMKAAERFLKHAERGNTIAQLQISTSEKTEIGAGVKRWSTVLELSGFLDLSSGDSKYTTYNAKVQESSHIFICDWKPVDVSIKAENSRLLVNGSAYDVMLIDDPMGLHRQLEIYLQYRGGQ